ncbi:MAG: bifunctional aspartate kinase/diaminopimelate decarboxylase [Xanthomonadales bacterium]|nr:bifunctional aspartate kinase/diaminopimelate decarboxylase [Xanthomonadales bacterium]
MPQIVSPSRWIVLKFGGTSVSKRERWDTIGELAGERRADGARVLVVVSALSGVTNLLQSVAEGNGNGAEVFAQLETRHRDFCANDLGLEIETVLGDRLRHLRGLLVDDSRAAIRGLDWQAEVLGQGELLSSTLGAAYLSSRGMGMQWVDAREWLNALSLPNESAWSARLSVNCEITADAGMRERFHAQAGDLAITQGFIARHADGGTAILGRGGSDTSAAYFGALLGAEQVEIWTDVPGMFSANPREVPDARLLARLDHAEAQEIATTGAKVLHPRSIAPCREAGVTMRILDTGNPHLDGTRIDASGRTVPGVKAISRRNGIVLVSMETIGMWQQVGFLADIFDRFRAHGLSIDMIGSSETNVTVSLDPSENLVNTSVLAELSADLAQVCRVKVIAPCAAITLVGRGMRSLLDRLSGVWATFGRERVHLISQSSNDLNLTFVVDESDADGMIPALHAELMRSGAMPVHEPGVFGPSWQQLVAPRAPRPQPWWANERAKLLDIAVRHTPTYAYHLPTVRERARALAAIPAIDKRSYAIKANPHPAILCALVEEGFGLECVSQGELEHVFASVPGLTPQQVLFTPNFAPIDEYRAALERGVTVTVDNVELLQQWPDVFRGRSLWLRIDLGYGDGHHAKVTTGGKDAKFGLSTQRFDEFVDLARTLDVRITGLHAHLGSGIETVGHWKGMIDAMAGFARRIGSVEILDIGGGLPIPYRPDEDPFDLAAWSQGLSEMKAVHPAFRIAIEPGRYLVAEAGVLLTEATQVVDKDGVRRVGLDAGMNTLIRPALYDAWHGIANLSRLGDGDKRPFDVVGPICESSDLFGKERSLPRATAPGDVMLVADAGAYGYSMASEYNLRALPHQEIIE